MPGTGFAVAAYRDGGQWQCSVLPPTVLDDLSVLIAALRSQPSEGGPFVVASVDDEFFLIVRSVGARISLLLNDIAASIDYPLAAQVLERLGEDPPDDDELDEIWPVGDLDIFSDLKLFEEDMEQILDDPDAYPDEMLDAITEAIGLEDEFAAAMKPFRN